MATLIDTSVLIAAERGQLDLSRVSDEDETVLLSVITASELLHGVHRLRGAAHARAALFVDDLLRRIPVLPFDLEAARVHGALSADLAGRGVAIGAHDLLIAATAILHDYDVATRDTRSFPKIRGLRVKRW